MGPANISRAFNLRDGNGKNQIEKRFTNRFIVTKMDERAPDIHIVYIGLSPGKPTPRELVKSFPDVLHSFRNIVAETSME
ncbi:hypothetical protein BG000_000382 [Podila horticola]|nr:hypothetical protein BG000_000382 [Podila horticola]